MRAGERERGGQREGGRGRGVKGEEERVQKPSTLPNCVNPTLTVARQCGKYFDCCIKLIVEGKVPQIL